jgi:hypothetical protein
VLILVPILNVVAFRRMLLAILQRSARMPKQPPVHQEQRTPDETSRLARDVMKRMLATPPTPHAAKQHPKKKTKSRRK